VSLLVLIVIGAVVGWLAGACNPRRHYGVAGHVWLGMAGAVVVGGLTAGAWLLGGLTVVAAVAGALGALVVAVLANVVLGAESARRR